MKKILLTMALSVSGTLIGYSFCIGDTYKIPPEIGCRFVDCYEETCK